MKRIGWTIAWVAALVSLGLGIVWERPVKTGTRVDRTSEYGSGQQPCCWGEIAVRDPAFRLHRGRGRVETGLDGSRGEREEGPEEDGRRRRRGRER